ncbi:unnamed protein product [Symbiodinium natans]|uniref:Uncharacterized protein n=1 Tax=Symbiodinium natans TaxID=878477 RepID=A0A812SJB1_9DINO|nr:unnamed protein product [Symbiodinium natans]
MEAQVPLSVWRASANSAGNSRYPLFASDWSARSCSDQRCRCGCTVLARRQNAWTCDQRMLRQDWTMCSGLTWLSGCLDGWSLN